MNNTQSAIEQALAERHLHRRVPYEFGRTRALDIQDTFESNARTYPRRFPIVIKRASGAYVEDENGNVYLDCLCGAGSLTLGHNHPVVIGAIRDFLDSGVPLQTLDVMTPVKEAFIQDLLGVLPATFSAGAKIQFCGPGGADAVEAGLKLVRTAQARDTILAFQGAYHGMSQGALQLMGNLGPKAAVAGASAVQFLPYPNAYQCPFGLGGAAGEAAGLNYIETVLQDPESGVLKPAGIILELVQGEGGVIPAPDSWTRKLREIANRADVPLIFDEVQTGLGRTGRLFAMEHSGVVPDVLVLSKAIGGGLPMSVVVYDGRLDSWQPGAHAGTFRGNQLAMAAGSATIRYVVKEALHEQAERKGKLLMQLLEQLRLESGLIGEVRGRGLMIGVQFAERSGANGSKGVLPPSNARAVQLECLRRGLIVELGGRRSSVARFLPPLTISEAQLEIIFEIFREALHSVERAFSGKVDAV
jgi:diaminobutyrate-2-oxoglutarate transaminase